MKNPGSINQFTANSVPRTMRFDQEAKRSTSSARQSKKPSTATGTKLEENIVNANAKELWQILHMITAFKPKLKSPMNDDNTFPNKLNHFYSRFDCPVSAAPTTDEACPQPFAISENGTRYFLMNF